MKSISKLTILTLVASAWISAALFYGELPTEVPRHWNVFGRPNGFTAKPWGAFILPLTMTGVWAALPILRRVAPRRHRVERFPGAFDLKVMMTIGLLFVVWMLVVAQSVSWLRAAAVPLSVALVVAGSLAVTMPVSLLSDAGGRSWAADSEGTHARWLVGLLFVSAGIGLFALVVLGR
jgi:uncharacterized membrane protein